MTLIRPFAIAATGVLAVGLAGCTAGTPGASPATSAPTTAAAACPVGNWRSSQVTANASALGATLTIQGGDGVALTIGADGSVTADFAQLKPITFTAAVSGAEAKGDFNYQGSARATVALPQAGSTMTATPSGGTTPTAASSTSPSSLAPSLAPTSSGAPTPTGSATATNPWRPTAVNWDDVRVTIRVTQPVAATLVDNVKLSDVTGDQTTQAGNAVDLQPILRDGAYQCSGDSTLVITSVGGGPTVTWTLRRA